MSIWGKIVGGAAGFALGGPLGALLGAVAGAAVDHFNRSDEPPADATRSIAFTIGVIALSAKMAKADGVVSPVEVETFKRLFRVPPDQTRNVERIFDLARRDVNGFEVYARQIARLFADGHAVLEELLAGLLRIAEADGELHPAELAYLEEVARIFGFTQTDFARILAEHATLLGRPDCDPYTVLGLPCGADLATVKAAYRQLVREHHPDLLIAQGLPQEFIDLATERMASVNAAYSTITARLKEAPL